MTGRKEKKGFVLYHDSYTWVCTLSERQKARLLDLLFQYAISSSDGEMTPAAFLDGTEDVDEVTQVTFGFMAQAIFRDTKKWRKAVETREAKRVEKEGGGSSSEPPPTYKHEQNCKPGSVFDSHLSRPAVADRLKPPPENGRASQMFSHGVAPNRVYSIGQSPADG